jgi:hypothetical protein
MRYNGSLAPSCRVCRRPGAEELRERWGCDRPAAQTVFRTSCPRCLGANSMCDRCGGSGEVDHRRCPASMIDDDVAEIAWAHQWLERAHVLPVAGGLLDQHPRFIRAVALIDQEHGKIEDERDRLAHARAKRGGRRG